MPLAIGHNVHKSKRFGVFIDLMARDFATNDFGKNVVGVIDGFCHYEVPAM